jgi:hypothetical protein
LNLQTGTQDPYEYVGGAQASGRKVMVVKYAGAARALRVDTNRGRLAISTPGSTYGHPAATHAIGVAATSALATGGGPFVGGGANPVETYSSDGPRRIFYNPDGSAITPGNVLFGTNGGLVLAKPDITAADASVPARRLTTFCGTSAAALTRPPLPLSPCPWLSALRPPRSRGP